MHEAKLQGASLDRAHLQGASLFMNIFRALRSVKHSCRALRFFAAQRRRLLDMFEGVLEAQLQGASLLGQLQGASLLGRSVRRGRPKGRSWEAGGSLRRDD